MKKLLLIVPLFGIIALSSCKKDNNQIEEPVKKATKISELNPSDNFDWATTKPVSLIVTPLPTYVPVERLLVVKGMDGTVYYNIYQKMDVALDVRINLPASLTKVKVEYGAISKEVDITANTIQFKYSPDISNED